MDIDPDVIRDTEAAALLDVKVRTVQAWIKAKRLAGFRLGHKVYTRRSEVAAFLARGGVPITSPPPSGPAPAAPPDGAKA